MIEIAGSLWSVPPAQQLDAAQRLKAHGLGRLHWDMTDGRFATAGGFNAERARELTDVTGLSAEAHIMAEHSAEEVDAWTEFCDLVIVHAESGDWSAAVDRITRRGCEPGLAISPATPVTAVPRDMTVLCMSIVPGTAGSAFDDHVLTKVAALRQTSPARRIGIDGGVKRDHAKRAEEAGAAWLVVGTDLFFHDGETRWSDLLVGGRSPHHA